MARGTELVLAVSILGALVGSVKVAWSAKPSVTPTTFPLLVDMVKVVGRNTASLGTWLYISDR